jgi:hypothetical protein
MHGGRVNTHPDSAKVVLSEKDGAQAATTGGSAQSVGALNPVFSQS